MTRSHATSKISTSSIILKLIILKLICVIYVACSIRAGKFLIGRNQQCQVHASSRLFGNERGLISRTAAGNRAYNKRYHRKVLLSGFYLNGSHTLPTHSNVKTTFLSIVNRTTGKYCSFEWLFYKQR